MNDDTDLQGDPADGTPDALPTVTERGPAAGPTSAESNSQEPAASPQPAPVTATIARPAASGTRTQNRIALAATAVVVVALIAGGAFLLGRGTGRTDEPGAVVGATPTPAVTIDPSTPVLTPAASASPDVIAGLPSEGARLGRADAKLTIEYWADYQCPFCAKFAEDRIPSLVPLIADGTIALVHRDYAFIGPESYDAAVAVRCAGREGKYWAMHDAVYAAQDGENKGAFARDRLAAIGESVGLDAATLEACLDDRTLLVAVLDDTAAAVRTAVQSTPTIDVNGTRFLGVPEAAELQAAIDEALAGASPKPLPSQAPFNDPWATTPVDGSAAGDATAPVTVDLWMDYESTDSATVARELEPELRKRIAAGKVRVVRHDLAILGDESVVAGTALRCVERDGGPTWLVHDILAISGQGAGAGIYTADNLLRLFAQLGLHVSDVDACLADATVAQAVRDETEAGKALGLDKAPGVLVSVAGREVGRFSGTLDVAKILSAVDKAK